MIQNDPEDSKMFHNVLEGFKMLKVPDYYRMLQKFRMFKKNP
jgi:hypothetical protein